MVKMANSSVMLIVDPNHFHNCKPCLQLFKPITQTTAATTIIEKDNDVQPVKNVQSNNPFHLHGDHFLLQIRKNTNTCINKQRHTTQVLFHSCSNRLHNNHAIHPDNPVDPVTNRDNRDNRDVLQFLLN